MSVLCKFDVINRCFINFETFIPVKESFILLEAILKYVYAKFKFIYSSICEITLKNLSLFKLKGWDS